MRTPDLRLALAAIVVLTVAGCLDQQTGAEGVLSFTYDTDDRPADLDFPIAIGAQIDLRVEDPLTGTPLPITQAVADDEGVIAIVAMENGQATLRGIGEGSTTLRVTATLRGESVSDAITISAAAVRQTRLLSGCADAEDRPAYLASSQILIPFELEHGAGAPLIGYGLYPFYVAPASAAMLDVSERSMQYVTVRTGPGHSRATLASTVDQTRLELEIVGEAEIDGASLRLGASGDEVAIGATRFVLARPIIGDRVLCQGTPALTVLATTPQICRVTAVRELREADDVGRTFGWVQVDGLAQGVCGFSVRYPNALGGAGVDVPFTMSVR